MPHTEISMGRCWEQGPGNSLLRPGNNKGIALPFVWSRGNQGELTGLHELDGLVCLCRMDWCACAVWICNTNFRRVKKN